MAGGDLRAFEDYQKMLELMGTCFGTYSLFLMDAGPEEARWLAQLTYDRVRRDVLSECEEWVVGRAEKDTQASLRERLDFLASYGAEAITSVDRLVESNKGSRQRVGAVTTDLAERFRRFVNAQSADVVARVTQEGRAVPAGPPAPSQDLIREAHAIIPRKAFPGYLGWEWIHFVSPEEGDAFLRGTGESFGWCAPPWMQMALFWSNGERNLLKIYDRMRASGVGVELERLIACIRGLVRQGFVTLSYASSMPSEEVA